MSNDRSGYPIAVGDGVGPEELVDVALVSDGGASHKLIVTSSTTLGKKVGFPSYDFDGPAGAGKIGLRPGDKVRLLSLGANNHDRVFGIESLTISTLSLTDSLIAGDGLVEFDFELIRRNG